eukprot:9560556-Karenia_brevis.AAC.1
MSLHKHGNRYAKKLALARRRSRSLLKSFIALADKALRQGGHVSFEWPRYCAGWALPELQRFIARWDLYS